MSKTNRISFQGDFGANSDMACRDMFPSMEPLPCPTFEDAFVALESGEADLAMIPIENTLAGRVADIHHLLPQSRLHITGEYFMPIRFQLMVMPGVSRDEIRTVHSHIHALGQCRNIVRANGWKAVVAGDTAGAAKLVAETGNRSMAALAPRLAAELYGLEIIAENVEDSESNVTRFVVLAREPKEVERGKGPVVTTFVFNVRNIPAALYKALGGFATNGVNMTKLESYQIGGRFIATQFYADIEGHPGEAHVARALDELRFFSEKVRILGTYPAHPMRVTL
ncbi:prephenate dehydratase [Rhizobium rhizosphaerae]|uniref:prephenate dehydratase n=1 Tax=Xaviernesmea rhizosphaerae TaxID=1672749 RepID=A0A1Q9AES6_9HYPH|nr:prephenate dehydratase [Xaviernesmea rhizosphaerae]OLP53457.1 prephenate dehydratase [Xaviernesmea rhizosphaerae]OQP85445.1 prephenate dehydratase [Xaviernesmea rhizosphaerae]